MEIKFTKEQYDSLEIRDSDHFLNRIMTASNFCPPTLFNTVVDDGASED